VRPIETRRNEANACTYAFVLIFTGGSSGYFVPRFYISRNPETGNIQYIIARRRAAARRAAAVEGVCLPVSIFY